MERLCKNCNAPGKQGDKFCEFCGHPFDRPTCPGCGQPVEDTSLFCKNCGYNLKKIQAPEEKPQSQKSEPVEQKIQQPISQQQQQSMKEEQPVQKQQPKKKSKAPLFISLALVLVLILAGTGLMLSGVFKFVDETAQQDIDIPADLLVDIGDDTSKEAVVTPPVIDTPSIIYPALYRSIDYVAFFKGGTSDQDKEYLLTVEISDFTHKYEQQIKLSSQEFRLKVRPPLLEGVLAGLNTSKEAQIKITLLDLETQKYLIQDSRPVTLMSKYDIQWVAEDGSETYYENILAWVTPEAPEIKELLRYSIDTLSYWSDGYINEIVGYQNIAGLTPEEITYYQTIAIFATMADTYGVRYNATPVTTSGNGAQQRVALPEDVLRDRSGLCIETTVTMASALQATGMHPLILILPGHSQVAIETWHNSGEYFLIETTALTADNWDDIIIYLTPDQWMNYLEQQQVIAIDVELANTIGIKPMK